MAAPSTDIKDILEAESSLDLTHGTDLFIGLEPSQPDNCVTIFDTPGYPPAVTVQKGEDYFYPSVLIRVRHNSYVTGWALIKSIRDVLHGLNQETWNGSLYGSIHASSDISFFDHDDQNRVRFIINFNLQRS